MGTQLCAISHLLFVLHSFHSHFTFSASSLFCPYLSGWHQLSSLSLCISHFSMDKVCTPVWRLSRLLSHITRLRKMTQKDACCPCPGRVTGFSLNIFSVTHRYQLCILAPTEQPRAADPHCHPEQTSTFQHSNQLTFTKDTKAKRWLKKLGLRTAMQSQESNAVTEGRMVLI